MADDKVTETPAETPSGEFEQPATIRKPDRNVIKDQEDKLKAEMSAIESQIKAVGDKAKTLQQSTSGKDDSFTETKTQLKELKSKREALIAERTVLYGHRDAQREARDAKMSEMKDLKSQTKFKDVGEVDKVLKKLELQQSTTNMPIAKEKELIKEMEELKKQRRVLAQSQAVASDLDGSGAGKGAAASQDHGAAIKDLNAQLSVVKKDMDVLQLEMNKYFDAKKDSAYPKLMEEKDALRESKKLVQDKVQQLWDGFKDAHKAWKENQAEWDKFKKQRKVQMDVENEARKEELKARRAEELAKKTPYEEEMDLCEYLANYLATTFIKDGDKAKPAEAAPAAVVGDLGGMQLMGSKFGDTDSYMASNGNSTKGLKKKGGKKGPAGTKKGKIVLVPETIESFSLLKMTPPTALDQVAPTVALLEAKKAEFKCMPRGQVLSIAEINQKLEIEAETARPRRDDRRDDRATAGAKPASAAAAGKKAGGSQKKVDVNSTELFPSLGGAKAKA